MNRAENGKKEKRKTGKQKNRKTGKQENRKERPGKSRFFVHGAYSVMKRTGKRVKYVGYSTSGIWIYTIKMFMNYEVKERKSGLDQS